MNPLYWLGWLYLGLLARRVDSPIEWRGGFVTPPGRVLVCFPEEYDAFYRAWRTLIDLGLDRNRMIFVARKPYLQAMGKREGEKRIGYEPGDVNVFGLAKRRLLQAVRRAHPAIAVDLHLESVPFGAHLCFRSGASVRAAIREAPAGRVFNILIRGAEGGEYEDSAAALFTYLRLATGHGLEVVEGATQGTS